MAGAVRHLLQRGGRYYARLVVPKRLRPIVGKVELQAPLGGDRREALRKLPAVVAGFHDKIAAAERRLAPSAPASAPPRRFRALEPVEMARSQYFESIAFDQELRDADPRYARLGIDDSYVAALREIVAGRAGVADIAEALHTVLDKFRRRGHHDHAVGSPEWRRLARILAEAELAALNVAAHRDEGESDPPVPEQLAPEPVAGVEPRRPVAFEELFEGYRAELQLGNRGKGAERRWAPVIKSLIAFSEVNDAAKLARRDVVRWKDHLLKAEGLSLKTVRDSYLATCRAAFNWAIENELIEENPFLGVKLRLEKKAVSREKGFNDEEASAVLSAALHYDRRERESVELAAAKRWVPWLAAYTGARVGELTQLRAEDVREQDGIPFVRLTPEAGTVKTAQYRDVPLHPHLVEQGFVQFARAKRGPLFFDESRRKGGASHPSRVVADRVAAWVRSLEIADMGVAPNHGWRHRLKTIGREAGIEGRVLDAIQGHAPRTAGDNYGDVTLRTKAAAIEGLPRIQTKAR